MESHLQLEPLFTWLKRAAEEERVDEEEPFRCAWTCLRCWIRLLQKIEPDADGAPSLSEDNLDGIASYVAERASLFYQCKASSCLDHRRVVEGDWRALADGTILLLYWAVQCRPNEHFIELIQALDEVMQLSIMDTIKKAAEQIDEQGALLHGTISIFSPGSAGKDSLTSSSPSDCSPILNTPKRPTHRALLATPSTRSRMYYSGLNSPAAIRWLCSPAICPDTSAGIRRRRTTKPARSEQVTHSTEGDKKEREVVQLKRHVQTLEESLRSQTALLEASDTEYQALSKDMARLRYENEVLRAEVSQVQVYKDRIDEMDSMTLKMAQLEKTNTRLEQVLSRQSEKKAEEVKLLEEESSRQHSCIQELEKALEEKKNLVVSVQLQLQAAQRQTARQEALAEAAEARLTKLKEENNELRAESFSVSCQVSEMRQQLAEWEAKCDHLSHDNLHLEERKAELLRQTEQLQRQVEVVRTEGEVHEQEALDNLRAELQALQESVLAEERAASQQLVEATQQANQKELVMERASFERLMEKEREGHIAAMEVAKKAFEMKLKETEEALQNILKDERAAHMSALEKERTAGQLRLEEAESTHQLEMICQGESLQHTLEEEREAHTAAMALEGKVLEMKLQAVKTALQEVIDEEQASHLAALEESNMANRGMLAEVQSELEAEKVSFQQLLARVEEEHAATLAEAESSHKVAMDEARAALLKTFAEEKAIQQSALEEANTRISTLCNKMEEDRMAHLSELQIAHQLKLEKESELCQEKLENEQKVHQVALDEARRTHLEELESVQLVHQKELEEMRAVYQRQMEEQKDALRDELLAAHHWELEEERSVHRLQLESTTNSLQAQVCASEAELVEERRAHQVQLENATSSLQAQLQLATAELAEERKSCEVQLDAATNSLQTQLRVALTELGKERMAHILTREKAGVAHNLSCGEEQSAKGHKGVRPASSARSGSESQHLARDRESPVRVTDENVERFGVTSVVPSSSVNTPLPPFPQQKLAASKDNPHYCSSTLQPRNTEPLHDPNRLSELQRRNSIAPPHLRSSYPVETQTKPESPKRSNRAVRLGVTPSLTNTSTLLHQHQEYPWQHTTGRPSDLLGGASSEKVDDRRMSLAFNLETGPSERQIPERLRLRMEASRLQREERQRERLEAAHKLKQQQEAAKKSKAKRKPLTSTNAARIK